MRRDTVKWVRNAGGVYEEELRHLVGNRKFREERLETEMQENR